jgi:hypothetical protein
MRTTRLEGVSTRVAGASAALARRTELVVRVRDEKRRWVALFKLPRLTKQQTATLTIKPGATHPGVSFRLAKGQLAPRYFGLENRESG